MKKIVHLLILMAAGQHVLAQCVNSGTGLSATTSVININCTSNDGSVTVNASDGWTDASAPNGTGRSFAITTGPVTRPTQSSHVFNSLPVGSYTISITDCNGTTITRPATIGGTTPTAMSASPTLFRSICAANNVVKIGPSGGRAPYTVSVVGAPAGSTPVISGDTIRGLTAGTLSYQVTDACGTVLGAATSIATNAPLGANNTLATVISYSGCNGTVGDLYFPNADSAFIRYQFTSLPPTSNLVADSFYTELYFNGVLKQTKTPATIEQLQLINGGCFFTGYGPGAYTLKTYAKCAGLIKTDSVIFGNRPASTPGTNTNIGIPQGAIPGIVSRFGCTDWDYRVDFHGTISGVSAPGRIVDIINPIFKLKVLSGASHVGDSVYSTATYVYHATITNLAYSATPYVFEVSDTCGNRDTIYYTRPVPAFTPKPTATTSCDGLNAGNADYFMAHVLALGVSGVPAIYPGTTTVLSGPALPYTSYPITLVDSVGALAPYVPRLPFPYPANNIRIAYENACGQKDTTVWTISCTPPVPGTISYSVTPHCGNLGDIALTNATSGQMLNVYYTSGPTNLASNPMLSTENAESYLNVASGTYVFRGFLPPMSANTAAPYYVPSSTAAMAGSYGYPLSSGAGAPAPVAAYRYSITYGTPVDTSALRVWDTTITAVVPVTNLSITAGEAYLCKDGSGSANVMIHPSGSTPPLSFQYSYSTTSGSGPWSSAVTDSLLSIPGVLAGQPIWLRTTDGCGSTASVNTNIQTLSSSSTSACNAGIATLTPSPNSGSFIYTLKEDDGTTTTYPYGTPITIDLNDTANTGNYTLYYRLTSGGGTGCIVDSVNFYAGAPCAIGVALPLQLLNFTGRMEKGISYLGWISASETGNKAYEVERSADGRSWKWIATVPVSTQKQSEGFRYSYNDVIGDVPNAYYRLKLVEHGGNAVYSRTLYLRQRQGNAKASVYPNPAAQVVNILPYGQSAKASYRLVDLMGRTVLHGSLQPQQVNTISVGRFPSGIYTLELVLDNEVQVQQLSIDPR